MHYKWWEVSSPRYLWTLKAWSMIHSSSWPLSRRPSWPKQKISTHSPPCVNKNCHFTVFINRTSPTTNGMRGSTPTYISDPPLESQDNTKSCSSMFFRNPTSSMTRSTQNNKRMSKNIPNKDIYHTSSSGRAAKNTINWRPIFRTTSQQVMTAWPRNSRRPFISWTSTPRIQWLPNPHHKDWHFLKRTTGTRNNMNTMTRSSGKSRSATTTERQSTQNPISETIPGILLIRSSMIKVENQKVKKIHQVEKVIYK